MKKTLAIILSMALIFSIPLSFNGGTAGITPYVRAEGIIEGDPLKYLESVGIMEGYEDGKLHPERTLTRAEFAAILCRAYPDVITHQLAYMFSDLPETHWAYQYIQKAVNAGWLKGNTDGTFAPDENITYEQALTVMCRVVDDIYMYNPKYPYDYVAAAIDYSLSDGVDAVIGEVINRGQAAQIIVNAINYNNSTVSMYTENSKSSYQFSNMSASSGGGAGGGGGGAVMSAPSEDYAVYEAEIVEYYNTESYSANEENVFKDAVTSPLSTFSIDTDTASYSNMRRFIINGQNIPNGSIRSEELINYFDYAKAETEEGKPFGVNFAVCECPWNSENMLAMVTVSGEELKESKPSNIVFLIDISGSMYSYNKLPLVKQSLSLLLDKLGENDKISIVTYASGTGVALEPTPATEKEKILSVIDGLQAGGSTAGESGIKLAYNLAEENKIDGNNRIILCTDGDFNVGASSDAELQKLIEEKRKSGIYLSVLGFGMGNYKDSKMEILADKGNGNYAYIDNLREAKKVLVDEMSKTIYTIAKDVKIQVEFNPETVSEYRLVGYENRLLNNEDFDNDQKDAGELGAGATVTVLYEIVPSNGACTKQLKYQDRVTTGSDDLMTVKIRYKMPDGNESILSEYPVSAEMTEMTEDFKFASAVAMFGMILNDSEYKGTSTLDSVIDLARQAIENDPYGIRNEFVQLVDLYRYQHK